MRKATAARHSAPTSCTAAPRQADDQAAEHRARHAADAAENGGGKKRQQQVEAHVGPDLDQESGTDAGRAGEAAPSSQVSRMTLPTSMPTQPASSGFSVTARIARPIVVRVIRRCMATTKTSGHAEHQHLVRRGPMPRPSGNAIWMARLK